MTAKSSLTSAAPITLRLAHLSDMHMTVPTLRDWREMGNKRAPGYLAWYRRRRHLHRREVLDALVADLATHRPDHLALTGDLTQLGLADECRQARRWLEQLGTPGDVSVIPGNHDTYAPDSPAATLGQWAAWMCDDPAACVPCTGRQTLDAAHDNRDAFPWVRRRGAVSLIGTSTALPTGWSKATGTLGEGQLERLGECLQHAGERGDYRVLLIHHVPCPDMIGHRKRLTDMAALAAVVRHHGVELVLHGHAHRPLSGWMATPAGRAPVVGAPSASLTAPGTPAGYGLLDISPGAQGWSTTATYRTLCGHAGRWHFETRESVRLPDIAGSVLPASGFA